MVLFALSGLVQVIGAVGWVDEDGATTVELRAVDQIAMSYEIPITDPRTHINFPSVLLVRSATFDTKDPDGSGVDAPAGMIFLSLQMSSGPIQRQYGQPNWGSFFSAMTPLPATALRYVAASGRSYPVTRVNPIDQTNNFSSATDDGLVDATYYFTVPISNRRGTLIISSTRTTGMQYQGFGGGPLVPLIVGGPTKVPLAFPKTLTVTVTSPKRVTPAPGTTFAKGLNFLSSGLNFIATVLAGLLVIVVLLARRRERRRNRPVPVVVVGGANQPRPEPWDPVDEPTVAQPPPVKPPTKSVDSNFAMLRVDVMGPLSISPVYERANDPVRAIVAFLAMNSERVQTLEEIQTAIWPLTESGVDIQKAAMRNYMVDARRTVGVRHLPTASGRAGYQLLDFVTDWTEFQSLLVQATNVPKAEATALRRQALDLARGLPFSGDTTRYFTWTFTSTVVYKIVESVVSLAHGLGTDFVLAGDLTSAQIVLRQGLLVDPASLTLWEDLTDVLLESTDQSLLDLHWKAAHLVLRSEDVALLRDRING